MTKQTSQNFITTILRLGLIGILLYFTISFLSDLNSKFSNQKDINTFRSTNRDENRLQTAINEKQDLLNRKLANLGIRWDELNLFIRAFKEEGVLEIWGKNNADRTFKKIVTYDFCALSGTLGPKRKSGDLQVPEGIYHINRFNEKSKFYLSLGINYPNKSDKIRGHQTTPGGDIFIHGDCQTIGCIPITDDKIKEVFLLAHQSKENGQHDIPVHIFPAKLTNRKLKSLNNLQPEYQLFWKELKVFYDDFERTNVAPKFGVDTDGAYVFHRILVPISR